MKNERVQVNEDGNECVHHWLIDERNFGVCKKCGVNKQFCNSWGAIQKSWYGRPGSEHHDVAGTKS